MVGLRYANPTCLAGKPCHAEHLGKPVPRFTKDMAEPLILRLGTDPSPLAQDDSPGKA